MINKDFKAQIGMSQSNARPRLLRSVLFYILCNTGLNVCFRCNLKILELKDFTLDHKENWRGEKNPELYFDVKNIGFSHLSCNSAMTRRRKCELGKHWCSVCKQCLDPKEFGNRSNTKSGTKRWAC